MATTSSAQKAAQVAARSGSSAKKGKSWLFPAAIAAIVILGVGIVWVARDRNVGVGDNDTPPLAQLTQGGAYDHWHSAFSVNVCGTELGPYSDVTTDLLGIHAHPGEALIHVHPFSLRSAGERAVMQHFFDQVGLVVTDTGFQTPEGDVYSEEETTCGGEATELTMSYWQKPLESTEEAPDEIYTEGFGSIRFREDRSAYSLALLPKGEVPAVPDGIGDLYNPSDLGDVGGAGDNSQLLEDLLASEGVDGSEPTGEADPSEGDAAEGSGDGPSSADEGTEGGAADAATGSADAGGGG